MQTEALLLPGTEVQARSLKWEVVSAEPLGSQTLYRLRGLEHSVRGEELDLLHPFEEIQPVQRGLQPEKAAPLGNWLVYHQAFLLEQALGPNALLAVQPGRLRIEAYQLVPVLRAIRMSRVRMLLADGVGLGKTIQAGLIITELVARRLAHRILIVSPAGPLMGQWQTELSERFGLRPEIIDRSKLEDVRRSTELGSNPFDHIPIGLVSVDFLKQERILEQLERATYDIVVIDEAHHCMDTGTSAERDDSQRRRLAEVLARGCDSLLLLTATPHDGHDRSFSSLCELLDPSLITGRGDLRGEKYKDYVVRRLKSHILIDDPDKPGKKKSLFPDRVVTPIAVSADPDSQSVFIEMQRGLLDLVSPELRRAFRNRNFSDVLAWIALLKRSVSTVAACQRTLSAVAERFSQFLDDTAEQQEARRQRIRTMRDYERKIERFGSLTADEEQERGLLEAEDIAQQLASMHREIRRGSYQQSKIANVVEHLDRLIELADTAKAQDPKLQALVATIRSIRKAEPKANILIYSEYIDSQIAAMAAIKAAKLGPMLSMNGTDDEPSRVATTERFRTEENLILVSTDSAAEGLNLHEKCHHLIHLELPFNPNRLEQRNGRIDRYGQKYEPQVKYLYLSGSFEERILLRLIAKYERQRSILTHVPNTLGLTTSSEATQEKLLRVLMDDDTRLFKQEPTLFQFEETDNNDGTDEASRELLEEIDRSLRGFREAAKTHTWLGDSGLNAEESLIAQASTARDQGEKSESVDLPSFVCDAVRIDGGIVTGRTTDESFTVQIPPQWTYGLSELPGYDADTRTVLLTTQLDVKTDSSGHQVGFLGRAHPLVRRAIDRVRNLSFGVSTTQGQDARVSAVKAPVDEPQLLITLLGRVSSNNGRELERVLAVRANAEGPIETYQEAADWHSFCDRDKAMRTTDLWKRHFSSWGKDTAAKAVEAATEAFAPVAKSFAAERLKTLERERQQQQQWLKSRCDDITGSASVVSPQRQLPFDVEENSQEPEEPVVAWQTLTDPAERLAAFFTDRNQTAAARFEAEGVLRIFKQRMAQLDRFSALRDPEIIQLGILMLIPEAE